jgi:hypothetical protein
MGGVVLGLARAVLVAATGRANGYGHRIRRISELGTQPEAPDYAEW